ncbi:hypothetical protein ACIBK8_28430 [Streptomyces sp. NPDC050161]|uniref:hypothetical protein n=1 Tax=Streptomyces sp. NPDC050161 TaxID=3365604 RepID=UPI0037ABCC5E
MRPRTARREDRTARLPQRRPRPARAPHGEPDGTGVHVEALRDSYFAVSAPVSDGFPKAAWRLGGTWDEDRAYWRFHDRVYLDVAALLRDHYGTVGDMLDGTAYLG